MRTITKEEAETFKNQLGILSRRLDTSATDNQISDTGRGMMNSIRENAQTVLHVAHEIIEERQNAKAADASKVQLVKNAKSALSEMESTIKQINKQQPETQDVTKPLHLIARAAMELAKSPNPITAEQAVARVTEQRGR